MVTIVVYLRTHTQVVADKNPHTTAPYTGTYHSFNCGRFVERRRAGRNATERNSGTTADTTAAVRTKKPAAQHRHRHTYTKEYPRMFNQPILRW